MKVAAFVYGGVFEVSTWLMGLQSYSFALADQPDLVAAISQRVGDLATATAVQVMAIHNVEMLVFTDDLGSFSGTLVSPKVIRQYLVDLLGRGSEEQVRARTRQILDRCAAAGTGYCLGTGNTAANYVPTENYLAMLDEGRRWNRDRFGRE